MNYEAYKYLNKLALCDHLKFVINSVMIDKDDRSRMQMLHQTPNHRLNGLIKSNNELILQLILYSPSKNFQQVIKQQKMPENMRHTFGSVNKIYELLKDSSNVQLSTELGKLKIKVPITPKKGKTSHKIVTLRLIQTRQELQNMVNAISTLKSKIGDVKKVSNINFLQKTVDYPIKKDQVFQKKQRSIMLNTNEGIKLNNPNIEPLIQKKMIELKIQLADIIKKETKRIQAVVRGQMMNLVEKIYEDNEREWERMVSFLLNNLAAMTENSLRNQFYSRQNSHKAFQQHSVQTNSFPQKSNEQQTINIDKNKFKKSTRSEQGDKKQMVLKAVQKKQLPLVTLKQKKSDIVGMMKRQKTAEIQPNFIDSSKQQNELSVQYSGNLLNHSQVQGQISDIAYNSIQQNKNPETQHQEVQKKQENQIDEDAELQYEEQYEEESESYESLENESDEDDLLHSLKGTKIKGFNRKNIKNGGKSMQSSSKQIQDQHIPRKKDQSLGKKAWKNEKNNSSKKFQENED